MFQRRITSELQSKTHFNPIDAGLGGKSRDDTIQNLDKENWNELKPSFRSAISNLCEHIQKNIMPKSLFKIQVSAPAFAEYITKVVDQLNNNQQVSLVSSFVVSIKYASEKSLKDAIDKYIKSMSALELPMSWTKLNEHHTMIYNDCYQILQSNLNGENDITRPYFEE